MPTRRLTDVDRELRKDPEYEAALEELLGRLAEARDRLPAEGRVPMFLKVAPDLEEGEVEPEDVHSSDYGEGDPDDFNAPDYSDEVGLY